MIDTAPLWRHTEYCPWNRRNDLRRNTERQSLTVEIGTRGRTRIENAGGRVQRRATENTGQRGNALHRTCLLAIAIARDLGKGQITMLKAGHDMNAREGDGQYTE